ncbi:MAG: hypothetical protein JO117_02820 [Verrucomicrobia bacterium]|nr:hypothetical protein [Verrucomicrobiota bacterium]
MSDPTPQPIRDLLPVQPSRRSRLGRGNSAPSSAPRATAPRAETANEAAADTEELPAAAETDAENALLPTADDTQENPAAIEPESALPGTAAATTEAATAESAPAPPAAPLPASPLPRPRPIPPEMRRPRELAPSPLATPPESEEPTPDRGPEFEPAGGFPLTFRERFLAVNELPFDVAPAPTLPAQTPDAAWTRRTWVLAILALVFVLTSVAAGYFIGRYTGGAASAGNAPDRSEGAVEPPTAAALADVEGAFAAASDGRYATARAAFETAGKRYPNWPTLAIEQARNAALAGDPSAADAALAQLLERAATSRSRGMASALIADAAFLRALLHVRTGEQDRALAEFALAVNADPTRADPYFFWGYVLRRAGKVGESVEKLRAAVRRNQQDNNRSMYQAELWLSQLEVGGDEAAIANAQLDAALTTPQTLGGAWIGLAARALRNGQLADAAGDLRRARAALDPTVFNFLINDPLFTSESWRPELAEFFR